jgi:hypothetical protein
MTDSYIYNSKEQQIDDSILSFVVLDRANQTDIRERESVASIWHTKRYLCQIDREINTDEECIVY